MVAWAKGILPSTERYTNWWPKAERMYGAFKRQKSTFAIHNAELALRAKSAGAKDSPVAKPPSSVVQVYV
jgi:hypothetical protein